MADNLRITTPIPGGENVNRLNPAKPADRAVVNPALVPPANADRQSGQQNNAEFSFLLNRNSVFSRFIQQLGNTPDLSQSLGKLVFEVMGRAGAEQGASISESLRQLTQVINMGREGIVQNLLFQENNRTQFSGTLFQMMRQILEQNPSKMLEQKTAQFLKAFNAYSGAGETTRAVIHRLIQISEQIPQPYSGQLQQMTQELTDELPIENLNQNLTALKEKIIPFLRRYISATNDFGRVRDNITLLVHDLSRLNISSREELAEKYTALLDYCKYDLNFPPQKLNEMTSVFLEHMGRLETPKENRLLDSVLRLLTENASGPSQRGQELFQNTLSSLLMDNSVYMPFHHLFLPLAFEGKYLFGEIWVEKEEDSDGRQTADGRERSRQIILTFDIKSKGYFEAFLTLTGKKISARLNCPAEFAPDAKAISTAVSSIFARNGFEPEAVELSAGAPPSAAKTILKKIHEGRRIVDVTV
ncbi:hypothetical protein [Faecalispora anaeroviscerum]|uniref:hypothetical protein n=1 Tax=Faecalispora anaeroviscerum TaxID=2991836 RepID=UPI0024BB5FC0|nr:hypothetical protein [Faecalispora anaeroviscerum]